MLFFKSYYLIDNKWNLEIGLNKNILKVVMKYIRDCEPTINISGEYIRNRPKGGPPYFKDGKISFKIKMT